MANKIAREEQIIRLKEDCDLTYQAREEGKTLISESDIDKLNTIETGAELNRISKITLNGEDVPIDKKVAKISIDEIVTGQLVDYIDNKELETKLTEALAPYAKNNEVENEYAKKTDLASVYNYKGSKNSLEEIKATLEPKKGDTYNDKSTGMNYSWDGSEWDALGSIVDLTPLETEISKKVNQNEFEKSNQELETKINDKADHSDIDKLEADMSDFITRDEIGAISGLNGFTVMDDVDIQRLWDGSDTVQTDKDQVNLTAGEQDTLTVLNASVSNLSVTQDPSLLTIFKATAQEKSILVEAVGEGQGSFGIHADSLREKRIYVIINPKPKEMEVDKDSVEVQEGLEDTVTITSDLSSFSLEQSEGSETYFSLSSQDKAITVSAMAEGSGSFTIKSDGYLDKTIGVTITPKPEPLKITTDKESISVVAEASDTLNITNEEISNITVSQEEGSKTYFTVSNEEKVVTILGVSEGNDSFKISADGYEVKSIPVTVTPKEAGDV